MVLIPLKLKTEALIFTNYKALCLIFFDVEFNH